MKPIHTKPVTQKPGDRSMNETHCYVTILVSEKCAHSVNKYIK